MKVPRATRKKEETRSKMENEEPKIMTERREEEWREEREVRMKKQDQETEHNSTKLQEAEH